MCLLHKLSGKLLDGRHAPLGGSLFEKSHEPLAVAQFRHLSVKRHGTFFVPWVRSSPLETLWGHGFVNSAEIPTASLSWSFSQLGFLVDIPAVPNLVHNDQPFLAKRFVDYR
jgi:hypothetical protein